MLDKRCRLAGLKTHSLQGIIVPDAIVKDWGRRKGNNKGAGGGAGGGGGGKAREGGRDTHHVIQQQQQQPPGHIGEPAGGQQQQWSAEMPPSAYGEREETITAEGLAMPASGGGGDDAAAEEDDSYVSSSVAYRLQRIRRMAPSDDRGMWLLNNLLTQTRRVEEKEDLCRSVHDKLAKRKEVLARTKDRRKLECDRRCVFTKAANETRTLSGMMAEANRFNVLTGIVKDYSNAKLRHKERHSHQRATGHHRLDPVPATAREGRLTTNPNPAHPSPHSRPRPSHARVSKVMERGSSRLATGNASTRTPRGGINTATAAVGAQRSPTAVEARKRQRILVAQTLLNSCQQGVSKNPVGLISPTAPMSSQSQSLPAVPTSRREVPGKPGTGAAQPLSLPQSLGLPPLQERYGAGVVDSWAQSPLALRLGRPRCQSVAIAELDLEAYEKYIDGILRPEATERQEEWLVPEGDGGATGKEKPRDEQQQRLASKGGGAAMCKEKPRGKKGGGGQRGEGDVGSSTRLTTTQVVVPKEVGRHEAVPELRRRVEFSGVAESEDALDRPRFPSRAAGEDMPGTAAVPNETGGLDKGLDQSRLKGVSRPESLACLSGDSTGEYPARETEPPSIPVSSTPAVSKPQRMVSFARGEPLSNTAKVLPSTKLSSCVGSSGDRGDGNGGSSSHQKRGSTHAPSLGGCPRGKKPLVAADSDDALMASTAMTFRSQDARKVFKQTERLLESLRTPARSSSVGRMDHGGVGGDGRGKDGRPSAVVVRYQTTGARGIFTGGREASLLGVADTWRGINKPSDRSARLAEVFRCVAPPHTVRIECDLHLHDAMGKADRGGGRERDAGGGGGCRVVAAAGDRVGMWEDFVLAWEYLGDGILAGRALYKYWEHVDGTRGDKSIAPKAERATDDLLSDGLMRALLFTRCYRSPGLDQLFVEWLDELLEAVREHVYRGCAKLPSLHGLTVGMGWFHEVCSTVSFGSRRRLTPSSGLQRKKMTKSFDDSRIGHTEQARVAG